MRLLYGGGHQLRLLEVGLILAVAVDGVCPRATISDCSVGVLRFVVHGEQISVLVIRVVVSHVDDLAVGGLVVALGGFGVGKRSVLHGSHIGNTSVVACVAHDVRAPGVVVVLIGGSVHHGAHVARHEVGGLSVVGDVAARLGDATVACGVGKARIGVARRYETVGEHRVTHALARLVGAQVHLVVRTSQGGSLFLHDGLHQLGGVASRLLIPFVGLLCLFVQVGIEDGVAYVSLSSLVYIHTISHVAQYVAVVHLQPSILAHVDCTVTAWHTGV